MHRDEFLHLDQAHHPAWGYQSVPPFTSLISSLVFLLGGGVFWVKFFPALFGALTLFIVWKCIEQLKGNIFALCLGATGVLISALLRLNMLYQPNSFDVLCWTGLYFMIISYVNTENRKWLYYASIIFALGFLNKYNIIFLLAGIFPAILLSKERKLFLKKDFYLSIFLGLLLIFPNLLWQYENDFPVFAHMKELAETQLVNVNRLDFLKDQMLFFTGSIFTITAGLIALLIFKPYRKFRFMFWSMIFTLSIFIVLKAKAYYAIGLYPIYIALGAVYLSHILSTNRLKFIQAIALALPILFFIPLYKLAFPNKSPEYIVQNPKRYQETGQLRWEDGKNHALPQDYADMLGWKELARKTDSLFSKLPDHTLVLCDNYGQAGAINYYSKQGIRAVSFNADYINWFDLKRPHNHFIRIKEYNSSILADSITNQYAREYRTRIYVFTGAKVDINKLINQEIEAVKKR
ncbi:MAG TPA: glycosyltransferase family 39 protein [Daejeonella sp.]|nr:glycosyltransferase family 39 protein [Daejeonella sp.]